jgi:hypothetical protein
MGAGVAKLKEQLEKVDVQLAVAALTPDVRAKLLEQKAAMEAELKAAQAMKSAHSAAAGAWCLFCSFPARPTLFLPRLPPHAPRPAHLTHIHSLTLLCPPFLQRRRPTWRKCCRGRRRRPRRWKP